MTAKLWSVGDVLTASDVNVFLVALSGVKSANQTTISSTTLINDADMRFPVAANSIYEFHAYVRYSSGTGQDWKSSFTVPAGAEAHFQRIGVDLSSVFGAPAEFLDTDVPKSQGAGTAVIQNMQFFGTLITGANAGNLIYQWAQNTSGAFVTTLYKYSYLTGRRIG